MRTYKKLQLTTYDKEKVKILQAGLPKHRNIINSITDSNGNMHATYMDEYMHSHSLYTADIHSLVDIQDNKPT